MWGFILAITQLNLMPSVIELLFLDQKLVHMITIYLLYHWYHSERKKESYRSLKHLLVFGVILRNAS